MFTKEHKFSTMENFLYIDFSLFSSFLLFLSSSIIFCYILGWTIFTSPPRKASSFMGDIRGVVQSLNFK